MTHRRLPLRRGALRSPMLPARCSRAVRYSRRRSARDVVACHCCSAVAPPGTIAAGDRALGARTDASRLVYSPGSPFARHGPGAGARVAAADRRGRRRRFRRPDGAVRAEPARPGAGRWRSGDERSVPDPHGARDGSGRSPAAPASAYAPEARAAAAADHAAGRGRAGRGALPALGGARARRARTTSATTRRSATSRGSSRCSAGSSPAGRLREGVTLPGVAAACLLLWSDARGGPAWWEHDGLDGAGRGARRARELPPDAAAALAAGPRVGR